MREHVRPSQTHAEEVVANAPGENFPVALRLLPARHRRHLTNLYFFARLTDDLGDEASDAGAPGDRADVTALRLRLLDELAADVDRIYSGETPQSPVMRAMAETVRECGVPAQPLLDLIEANRQDQRVTRYPAYRRPGAVLRAVRQPRWPDRALYLRRRYPGTHRPLR